MWQTILNVMTIINALFLILNLFILLKTWPKKFKILQKETEWATQVRTLANQFTAIERDIKDNKYGEQNQMMIRIAEDIQRTNGMTHGLWDRMKRELDIED